MKKSGSPKVSLMDEDTGIVPSVKELLGLTLKKYNLDTKLASYSFVLQWPEIVGEEIARHAKPECIKDRKLVIRVPSSVWAQELTFQQSVIVGRLNEFVKKDDFIDGLLFYVDGKGEETTAERTR